MLTVVNNQFLNVCLLFLYYSFESFSPSPIDLCKIVVSWYGISRVLRQKQLSFWLQTLHLWVLRSLIIWTCSHFTVLFPTCFIPSSQEPMEESIISASAECSANAVGLLLVHEVALSTCIFSWFTCIYKIKMALDFHSYFTCISLTRTYFRKFIPALTPFISQQAFSFLFPWNLLLIMLHLIFHSGKAMVPFHKVFPGYSSFFWVWSSPGISMNQ